MRFNSNAAVDASTASGAPMTKRRLLVAGSNGAAVRSTPCTSDKISATGSRSANARAVGTIPFGVLRNNGSLSRRRRRARPWLTADEVSRSRSAARPT